MNAGRKIKRHAAVRPDVFAGNQRLRTWLYKLLDLAPLPGNDQVVWIAELGEGRYLRCFESGRLHSYECMVPPIEDGVGDGLWEEL